MEDNTIRFPYPGKDWKRSPYSACEECQTPCQHPNPAIYKTGHSLKVDLPPVVIKTEITEAANDQ